MRRPVVLVWALQRLPDLPSWDTNSDLTTLYRATGIVPAEPASVTAFLAGAQNRGLRPLEEIRLERDRAEAWHWRSRAQQLLLLEPELQSPTAVQPEQGRQDPGTWET